MSTNMSQRSSVDEVRIGQWLSELLLGTKLAFTGGRSAWARLMLSAVGIGLGVMVLLLAASIAPAQQAKADRSAARALGFGEPVTSPGRPETTHLLGRDVSQIWQGTFIGGAELAAQGGPPTLPPGLDRLPGPGELVPSPALARLLAEPGSELLRERLPGKVVGAIGEAGLTRPGELFFYAGLPEHLRAVAQPVVQLGSSVSPQPLPELFQLLLTAAAAALLVPIGVFVLVATQIGAGAREQRLASIRLVGADPGQARRIAAGESLAAALLGLGVGAGLFLAVRSLAAVVEIEQIGFFPGDVTPSPPLTLLLLLGVPCTAVAAALFALRRLEIGPLGVVRRADPPARRLGWRLVLTGLGVLVLLSNLALRLLPSRTENEWRGTLLAVGIALVLSGLAALLPWLVERLADHWRPPGVAALLAVRRLRFEYATTRVVAGVMTVLIGAIALQVLLGTIARTEFTDLTQVSSPPGQTLFNLPYRGSDTARIQAAAREVPGVTQVGVLAGAFSDDGRRLQITDCATIEHAFEVTGCRPGRLYQYPWTKQFQAGSVVQLRQSGRDQRITWVVPPIEPLPAATVRWSALYGAVLATGANPVLDSTPPRYLWVRGEGGDALTDRVLAATGRVDLDIRPYDQPQSRDSTETAFASVRGGTLAGTVVVVLLAVLSLVVAAVDQLQERRRQYSVLAASGVPRRTLGWAALWQNTVPTAVGLLLAAPAGIGLAALILRVVSSSGDRVSRLVVNWGDVGMILGAGAALIVLVTLSTLPALRSAIRPSGLRFE